MALPKRSPGAGPGQGSGLIALTKSLPSPSFPEKGVSATRYHSALTLEGAALAWLLEWTVRRGKVWGQEEVGRGTACGRWD